MAQGNRAMGKTFIISEPGCTLMKDNMLVGTFEKYEGNCDLKDGGIGCCQAKSILWKKPNTEMVNGY